MWSDLQLFISWLTREGKTGRRKSWQVESCEYTKEKSNQRAFRTEQKEMQLLCWVRRAGVGTLSNKVLVSDYSQ